MEIIDDESEIDKFEEIYLNTRDVSYRICYKILKDHWLAEDAVSETYYKLARCFSRLSKEDDKKILNYIKISSKHSAYDIYNKRKRYDEKSIDTEEIVSSINLEEMVVDKISIQEVYEKILMKLPNKYYEVLYMSIVLNMTLKEISMSLNRPMSTIYKRYERAKDEFNKRLEKYM